MFFYAIKNIKYNSKNGTSLPIYFIDFIDLFISLTYLLYLPIYFIFLSIY